MKSARASKPGHVTKGDVLNDLGLSRGELIELKVKTELWRDLVACITPLGLTQKELAQRLGVHQPEVSHLLSGKLSKFSVGTLIQYAVTMGLGVQVRVTQKKHSPTVAKSLQVKGIGKAATKHLVVAVGD
jgi:predicted XRE-type DNA-binding protein